MDDYPRPQGLDNDLERLEESRGWLFEATGEFFEDQTSKVLMKLEVARFLHRVRFQKLVKAAMNGLDSRAEISEFLNRVGAVEDETRVRHINQLVGENVCAVSIQLKEVQSEAETQADEDFVEEAEEEDWQNVAESLGLDFDDYIRADLEELLIAVEIPILEGEDLEEYFEPNLS